LAEGFQRRRLKCEKLTDDWCQKLTLPLARWTKKLMNDGHKVLGEYYLSLWLLWYEKHAYLIFGKVLHIHINHLRFYPLFQTDKFKQTMAFSLLINHYFFSKFIVAVNFVHHNENSYQKLLLFYFCLLRKWFKNFNIVI
jgi:hypothetical protein